MQSVAGSRYELDAVITVVAASLVDVSVRGSVVNKFGVVVDDDEYDDKDENVVFVIDTKFATVSINKRDIM